MLFEAYDALIKDGRQELDKVKGFTAWSATALLCPGSQFLNCPIDSVEQERLHMWASAALCQKGVGTSWQGKCFHRVVHVCVACRLLPKDDSTWFVAKSCERRRKSCNSSGV